MRMGRSVASPTTSPGRLVGLVSLGPPYVLHPGFQTPQHSFRQLRNSHEEKRRKWPAPHFLVQPSWESPVILSTIGHRRPDRINIYVYFVYRRVAGRRLVVQRTVRAFRIVLPFPKVAQRLRPRNGLELLTLQELVAQPTVKRLGEAVLSRAPGATYNVPEPDASGQLLRRTRRSEAANEPPILAFRQVHAPSPSPRLHAGRFRCIGPVPRLRRAISGSG